MIRLAAGILSALMLVVIAPSSARAHPPVYFVHGVDLAHYPGGTDCDQWNRMKRMMRRTGRNPPSPGADWAFRLRYYARDRDCDISMGYGGRHRKHHSGYHHPSGGHTVQTSIRHLGYHFAWTVWRLHSKLGNKVDVVAHSMGGLITRYALAQVQRNHPQFPRYLLVQDVVTFGTPHQGAKHESGDCPTDPVPHFQCMEMAKNAAFIRWLGNHARHPQPSRRVRTRWHLFGSRRDAAVNASSATGMRGRFKIRYLLGAGIGHSTYQRDTSDATDPPAIYKRGGGTWNRTDEAPHPAFLAHVHLTFSTRNPVP